MNVSKSSTANWEPRNRNWKPSSAMPGSPIESDAQLALSENSEYEKKRAENSTQLRLVQFLAGYANNPDHAYEVLPVNVGLTDTGLAELINRYNEMLLERKRCSVPPRKTTRW